MKEFEIVYTESFRNSLNTNIDEWETKLFLSEEKIRHFVQLIYQSLEQLKAFPEMYEEVSALYGLEKPTYRVLIGKTFAIFYRIDKKNSKILIGNFFKQKQMKVQF
ncbi:type II toxin-antitoxin system RelE/ParE family toxin [Tetragenococcus halophilus]|uniref:Type II toxin-antitoxin system RelE/ParE family toxin n=2 Tax=Tetragenococcus halophilus TaxID=51669 RepID=A0A2H6CSK7_TETHA|nr:type II toxin-antitoxin system RelE/ParE family toxin [Tetragenococcus halophilus]AYW50222.1 type II toxin-antitoxin system RelE/ParE family toxin [Tetragenococcus halophilus]MCF1602334.1 type II toxin-antitoxin system RelE/ParE family toxin [Tetragenococcus halophilus]MCF1676645.1 type II toxin-antitoxin system RelE/ParE family toxin [Tetragenococcus halophilus]MCO8289446.1 type II toxin-antitoxin system RelE/ParE family toxin [Tetragenococcus halophilus]MCO8291887.1 type II toxin-antitoxi